MTNELIFEAFSIVECALLFNIFAYSYSSPFFSLSREHVVGWYHTGPKLKQNDLEINEIIRRYIPNPVLIVIDVRPKDVGLPTDAYIAVEEIGDDEQQLVVVFITLHPPWLLRRLKKWALSIYCVMCAILPSER